MVFPYGDGRWVSLQGENSSLIPTLTQYKNWFGMNHRAKVKDRTIRHIEEKTWENSLHDLGIESS